MQIERILIAGGEARLDVRGKSRMQVLEYFENRLNQRSGIVDRAPRITGNSVTGVSENLPANLAAVSSRPS